MAAFKSGNLATPIKVVKAAPALVLDCGLAWEGPFEHVFAKILPIHQRCIEAVCAWLAQQMGVPVPAPRFLHMWKHKLPRGHAWPFGREEEATVFATVAVEGAMPLTRFDGSLISTKFAKWPYLELCAVFDLLIANDDRTAGNILMAPKGELCLIDHARSLGGGGDALFSTQPLISNFFLGVIAGMSLSERNRRRPALISACLNATAAIARIPYEALLVPADIASQVNDFLVKRGTRLQATVLDAVGLPDIYDHHDNDRSERGLQ